MSTSNARLEKGKLGPEQGFSSHQQTVDFMDLMAEAIRDGYRFVPVLGAGISSSAGVPIVSEMSNTILPFWVFRSLPINPFPALDQNGIMSQVFDETGTLVEGVLQENWLDDPQRFKSIFHTYELRPWVPGKGYWPDLRLESLRNGTVFCRKYARSVTLRFLEWMHSHPTLFAHWHCPLPSAEGDERLSRLNRLFSRALAALEGDWLDMIDYLAKLSSEVEGRRTGDPTIPDSIFTHLCDRREPALPHRMLAALSPVWRSTVLLTTNFDPLIEDAYRLSGKPRKAFDVPKTTPLPGADLVLREESVVKLHGGRFGLRADHSLDSAPTDEDRDTFLSYLLGRPVPRDETEDVLKKAKVALIVLGTRVEDLRLRQLLPHAGKLGEMKVFYVGRSKWIQTDVWQENKDVYQLKCPDPGLFLLNLFQHLTGTIPASGCFFPTSWRNARPPFIEFDSDVRRASCDEFIGKLKVALGPRQQVLVKPAPGRRWGLTLCSRIFQAGGPDCLGGADPLWLDLEDVVRPVDVLTRMMLAAGHLGGEQDPQVSFNTANMDWGDTEQVDALRSWVSHVFAGRHAGTGRKLVFFIALQEGPGIRASQNEYGVWDEFSLMALVNVLHLVQSYPRNGVQIVWVASSGEMGAHAAGHQALTQVLENSKEVCKLPDDYPDDSAFSLFNIEKTIDTGDHWLVSKAPEAGPNNRLSVLEGGLGDLLRWKKPFLALLCSLRGDTYPACVARAFEHYAREIGLAQSGKTPPTPGQLRELCHLWLRQLDQEVGMVRSKPGGFVWMNSQVRTGLLARLALNPIHDRPWVLDFQLARWHGRLLLASSDPLAAVEAVFYLMNGLRKMPHTAPSDDEGCEIFTICKYAMLLLTTAKGLFEVHISSQFARQYLEGAAEECLDTLKHLRGGGELRPEIARVVVELYFLLRDIGCSVALRQSEFDVLIPLRKQEVSHPLTRLSSIPVLPDEEVFSCSQTLFGVHAVGGLVCRRRYMESMELAERLWLDLCGHASVGRLSWDLLSPGGRGAARVVSPEHFSYARTIATNLLISGKREQLKHLCRLGRWMVYHHLSRSQIDYLHDNLLADTPEKHGEAKQIRIRQLETCLGFYHFTTEMLRSVQDTQDGFVFSENVRLRAHAALAQAVIAAMKFRPGPAGQMLATPEADLLLTESLTFIEEFPLKDEGVTAGVLSLRRAEIQIIKVATSGVLKRYRAKLKDWALDVHDGQFLQGDPDSEVLREELTLTSAFAHDALRYLREAETCLLRSPKSRWWWTVYAALKMKAVEYLYVLRAAWAEDEWRLIQSGGAAAENGTSVHPPAFDPYITDKLVTWDAVQYFRGGVADLVKGKGLDDFFNLSRLLFGYLQTLKACLRFHVFRSQCLLPANVVEREFLKHRMRDFAKDLHKLIVAAENALPNGKGRIHILESAIRYHHTVLDDANRAHEQLIQNVIDAPAYGGRDQNLG